MRRLLAGALCAVIVGALAAPAAAQTSRRFDPVAQTDLVDIAADGSFLVRERRTIRFTGRYTRYFLEIPRSEYTITDVLVSEGGAAYQQVPSPEDLQPGRFFFDVQNGAYQFQWAYDARDETRQFDLQYRVAGAVVRYADVAEFAWTFVGAGNPTSLEQATAAVALPPGRPKNGPSAWMEPRGEVRADVHGDARPATTVTALARNLAPHQPFAVRIAFDPGLVPGAPSMPGDRLPTITAQVGAPHLAPGRTSDPGGGLETGLANWGEGVGPYVAGSSLLLLLVALLPLRRRRPGPADADGPPEALPVAFAGWILRDTRIGAADMAATMLDLARRGFVSIEAEADGGFRIALTGTSWDGLEPFERVVLVLVQQAAGDRSSVGQDDLRRFAATTPGAITMRVAAFRTLVAQTARHRGLAEPRAALRTAATLIGAAAGGVLGLAALSDGGGPNALLAVLGCVAMGVGAARRLPPSAVAPLWSLAALPILWGASRSDAIADVSGVFVAMAIVAAHAAAAPVLRQLAFRTATGARAWERYVAGMASDPDAGRAAVFATAAGVLEPLVDALDVSGRAETALAAVGLPPDAGARSLLWFTTGVRGVLDAPEAGPAPEPATLPA